MIRAVRAIATVALMAAIWTAGARSQPSAATPAASPGRQGPGAGRGGPPPDPAAVARGRETYTRNCATCHGPEGRGGGEATTDLTQSVITSSPDGAQQLMAFLRAGRPERRMPSFALPDGDVADMHAFLRSVAPPGGRGRGFLEPVIVGNAKAGEAYFNGPGRCTQCHSVTGNLKGIGARLPVATIQGRIVVPRGSGGYPRSFSSPPDPNEPQRTVTITHPSGETLSGTLWWITDFYVTLVDAGGVRRTVARSGDVPKVVVTDPLQYHIDHMKTLTDEIMHDLTAYFVTLK